MRAIVDELRKILSFKPTTEVGDIVLVAAAEPHMVLYAKVTGIERDISRRDEWWHVHLTLLSIPLQHMTWTLRTEQMTGKEIFTMGGKERFVAAVDIGAASPQPERDKAATKPPPVKGLRRVK